MAQNDRLRLTFLGAARTVTGSMHLLEAGDESLLVDCGLFQGKRNESRQRNRDVPRKATGADAVLLTHAHIDHCGNLPNLVKRGFAGRIHCTDATADLASYMLRDSARIHEYDAKWLNKKHKHDPSWEPIEPLYTEEDAERALDHLEPHPYEKPVDLFEGVQARFIDAGHVLGSASVVVDVRLNGHRRRIAFSGDIGRRGLPILRDPVVPEHADYVVMETTYGDRTHGSADDMQAQLLDAVQTARDRGGRVIIPSFALERTQEIVFALNQLRKDGKLEPIPVYVDSPLAVNLTHVFSEHEECYDKETVAFENEHGDPFGFHMLSLVESVEESKKLNGMRGPAIIISASGMCEAGRVLHHLRNAIEDDRNMILIVGYQAQHTLGRRLVERRRKVRLLGLERDVNAEVRVLNAFSAHADRDELLWWAESCGRQVRKFFLVHGDPDQSEAFGEHLAERQRTSEVPSLDQTVELDY
jgi:metallo-beta-lactamase family protein